MRAIYINAYGGSENLIYGELPDPVPDRKQVLIRVAVASVNPVDWKVREGRLKFLSGKRFPMVMGSELSGTIESTGKGVKDLKPGDRVYAGMGYRGGGYAEKVVASQRQVIRIPDKLSFHDASTLAIAGVTPLQAFTLHHRVRPGDEVLVNGGSGGVGTYAIQIAKVLGARVTAVCSERNIEMVKNLGADEVIDYNRERFTEREAAFDVVLDAASNVFFPEARGCLKRGGTLIKLNLTPGSLFRSVWTRLIGSRKLKMILLKNRPQDVRWMIDHIVAGKIQVVTDRIFPLEKAREAQEYSQTGRARGKVLIEVNSRAEG